MSSLEFEIERVSPERTAAFRHASGREALSTLWGFPVVWHEQRHELAATIAGEIAGVLGLWIAASLARVESLVVAPAHRRIGIGTALLDEAESLGKYYNCHKVTLELPAEPENAPARLFFAAREYNVEAVLRQHTWKRDVAVMRKFLL